ncbi:chitobiase/beta-hexosaminidase C-terminal domain-containing protein [Acetobacterium tundrae]|uniref:GH29D-like beta-sandwich domain-containing protein n=1 Tax=Acetobacterium tundrae TaxID=132932 RepID=A0ABR6WHU3_9FIRM|nr:chitobiase/beta-hexosaminidase C-terminal domain-containing protein [Acetobacterium tundrae]MBC3796044.1 hypothetical protein [Acetobacterium tundrae]
MNDEEKVTGKIESVQGNDELPAEEMDSKNQKTSEKSLAEEIPPHPKGKKKLIIILGITGGILILAVLAFFLVNQFNTSNSNQNSDDKTIENTTDKEELKKLYDELISSYVASGKSEAEILALLEKAAKKTGDQSYITEEENYVVKNPSFNLAPGAYQGTQSLEIVKGNATDKLFYTLDGNVPEKTSTEYTSPISLSIGETTVKVIEVNSKDVCSSVLAGNYILTSLERNVTTEELINRISGVWYKEDTGSALQISQTTFREYIPKPLSTAGGDFVVVSTTENGGTIKISDFTVDGNNQGDMLVDVDLGAQGDNKFSFRYEGRDWREFTAADYLGGNQYRLPFTFAGSDIMTMN